MKNYLGSKGASGAFQAIIAAMPQHDTYIETHLGSGVVLRKKPRSVRSIAIDRDHNVIAQHQLEDVELHCCDALAFLNSFDFESAGRTLIYSDPPYLHSTRTSNKRYRLEYSVQDHINLLEFYTSLKGVNVMISGYPSRLYDEMLHDWRKITFQAMTRGGVRTECLWLNYEPDSVFWSSYAGEDFTDRQRIKRKAERWAKNYATLPENEKIAVLSAILATDKHS